MHPFLFENGDQFLQFGPPSKSLRWKGSPKMHLFKNALQRGNFMTTEVFEKDYAKVLDTSKRACSHQRWYRFQWLLRFFADRQKQFKKFFGTSVKVNLISSLATHLLSFWWWDDYTIRRVTYIWSINFFKRKTTCRLLAGILLGRCSRPCGTSLCW